jgi:hypothetical protein
MSKIPSEKDLYPLVEKWMKRHFLCFKTAINTGLKYSRVDVLGIRDVGGDLSGEVETIVIEVKGAPRHLPQQVDKHPVTKYMEIVFT